ncbi:MAG: lysylphosphatidylglycerol synthase transmembrane domain-containing protein [Acidimicrobiales bacterium]
MAQPPEVVPDAAAGRKWWHIPRFLRNGLVIGLLILAAIYVVAYLWPEAEKYVKNIEHVNIWLLLLGLGLEVGSLFAFAKLTVVVLPPGSLSISKAWRINLASLAFGHVIPGGTAGGTGMSIRLMTSEGLRTTDVGFATATMGIGSAVLLNAMLWLALIISIPLNGFRTAYVYVALASLLVLAFFAALIAGFAQGDGWAVRVLRWLSQRFRFIPQEKLEGVVKQIAERIKDFWGDSDLVRRSIIWAALNWLLDASCLWVALSAFHYYLNPIDLFVAYGVGNVVAVLPFTPGGLGTVEFATILMLKGFGVPPGIAAAAVLAWRLFNFWLPIPVGGVCYLSVRAQRGTSLRELASEARHPHSNPADAGPAVPPMS